MKEISIQIINKIEEIKEYMLHCDENTICVFKEDKIETFFRQFAISYQYVELQQQMIEIKAAERMLNDKRRKNITIFFGENKEVQILALYFSNITKRNIMRASIDKFEGVLAECTDKFGSVCIITEECYVPIIQTLVSSTNYETNVGIIVGRNVKELLYIINKNIIARKIQTTKALTIDRTDKLTEDIYVDSECYTYMPYSVADKMNILNRISKKVDIFSFMGHGRDELLWITNGVICGGVRESDDSNLPSCKIEGRCLKKNIDILNVDELYALNLFVNACSVGKVGNAVFGNGYNTLQNLLGEFVVTCIGTPFLANRCEALVHYYTSLIMSGIKLGVVCGLMNSFYSNYRIGLGNSYFLFGDPEAYCISKYHAVYMDIGMMEQKIIEFELEEDTPLLCLYLHINLWNDFINLEKSVVLTSGNKQIVYCHMFWDELRGMTNMHIFTKGILKKGKFILRIEEFSKSSKRNVYMLNEFEPIFNIGIMENKHKRFYQESLSSLENFEVNQNVNMTRLDNIGSTVYAKRKKICDRIDTIINMINMSVQEKVHKKGVAFDELCMANGFNNMDRRIEEEKCPYCNGRLFENRVFNEIYKIKRKHYYCFKCGNILDTPENSYVNIGFKKNKIRFDRNSINKVEIYINNLKPEQSFGTVTIAVVNGQKDEFSYEPSMIEFELEPFASRNFVFEIQSKNSIACHNYWLMGIAVVDSQLYVIKQDIFYGIGEKRE